MFKAVRRHVNATSLVAVMALVFAMTGGAWAAKRYLITSTKQISPKVLSALKGKAGPAGPAGPAGAAGAGTAGPAGLQGPAGAAGAKGETGPAGTNGTNGTNGKPGKDGEPGEPWTPNNTLPKGATETGVWAFGPLEGGILEIPVASFTIKLEKALEAHVHFINPEGEEEIGLGEHQKPSIVGACLGSVADPSASSGNLCIYANQLNKAETANLGILDPATGGEGAGKAGALLFLLGSGNATGAGTWAVTG